MVIFMHSAEKCLQIMETHYALEYMAGNDYKYLCKLYGKPRADQIVKEQVAKIIRGDKRNELGKILKTAQDSHKSMEKLFDTAIKAHDKDVSNFDTFNALQHDVNFLCYCYALMCNCPKDEDEIKVISTIKALAKGHRVSDNVLDKLKIQ